MWAQRVVLGLTCCLTSLGLGCARQEQPREDVDQHVLAVVNGEPISEQSFRHWWDRKGRSEDTPVARAALLDKLIHRSAMVQKARAAGVLEDPELLEAIRSLLIARLREQQLQPKIAMLEISDAEAHATYLEHCNDRFRVPARCRVAVLWFDTRGQKPLEARYVARLEKARRIFEDQDHVPVERGFGQLAISYSEHAATRYKGGDVGWMEDEGPTSDAWRSAIRTIADGLQNPGDMSQVVTRDTGVFLVRLIDRKNGRVRTFEEVKDRLIRELYVRRRSELEHQFEQEALLGVEINRFPDRLQDIATLATDKTSTQQVAASNIPFEATP